MEKLSYYNEGDWLNHQKRKILCYLNHIIDLSWFDKRKNVVITNHEHIFFTGLYTVETNAGLNW